MQVSAAVPDPSALAVLAELSVVVDRLFLDPLEHISCNPMGQDHRHCKSRRLLLHQASVLPAAV
jgi:hypothetical protein